MVPIYKSGDRASVNDYRPITILPVLSKIFEKSCSPPAVHLPQGEQPTGPRTVWFSSTPFNRGGPRSAITENILDNMDNGFITDAVFLDLSKAFCTVDHQILLKKLHCLGLNKNSMEWFKSHLSDREQVTSIGNGLSSLMPVTVGVPQGGILGPLLFIVYVNDLPRCLMCCKVILLLTVPNQHFYYLGVNAV